MAIEETIGQWKEWDPFIIPELETVFNAYSSMPRSPIKKVPLLVRMLENPRSPIALAGPTTMLDHDCIHIVLGRGLLPQDEGFVIGYSIGNASHSSALDRLLFHELAPFYPNPYKFTSTDLRAFDYGFDCGARSGIRNIHLFHFENNINRTIGAVREQLGISRSRLLSWFREELGFIPESRESRRLRSHVSISSNLKS